MKLKLIVAATALAITTIAGAQSSMTATYGVKDTETTNIQSHVANLSVKTRAFNNIDVDLAIATDTTDLSNSVTNRYELGVTQGMQLSPVLRGDVRVATGLKQKSGTQEFSYYSVEPGVSAKFGDFSARVAYRFRDAYDSTANSDRSNTMRYSVSYAITKKDTVRLGYDVLRGASTQTTIGYTRSF